MLDTFPTIRELVCSVAAFPTPGKWFFLPATHGCFMSLCYALLYLRYTREVSDPAHRQEYLDYLAQIEALRGGCQRCSSAATLRIYWWCLRPIRIEFRVPDEFVRKCQAGWGCSTEPRQAKGEMPEGQQLLRCQPGLCVTRCTNLSTFAEAGGEY